MRSAILFLLMILTSISCISRNSLDPKEQYNEIFNQNWKEVFNDSCTQNWQTLWSLDGTRATVKNSEEGMDFWAGAENKNDTCHAVLWTKNSFKGDILLKYEYTRLDSQKRNVNIIYIQATGAEPHDKDIHSWAEERRIPSMWKYFKHMHTLHISYAAFGVQNMDSLSDYLRARRYMPEYNGLQNTNFGNAYEKTGFFKTGVPHTITIIKRGNDLFMQVKNKEKEALYHWNSSDFPPIEEGYIGLRHMYTRGSRYKNFKIYQLK